MSASRPILAAAIALAAARPQQHHALSFFFHLGIVGLFLVSTVDSSFVPLPIPGVTDILLIVYAAAHSNPFMLVAIATAGSALGGFLSHAVGQASGIKFLEKRIPERILKRITAWMENHAILAVSLPALLPPPMPLSPFVLIAGAVHMSRKKFMWSFTVSRLLRHCIAVWLGIRYGRDVIRLWQHFSAKWATSILIGVWSLIVVFTAIAVWKLYKTSRAMEIDPLKRRQPKTAAQ
jgi:membrane protein DedA with SNARE-associated domain